MPKCLNVASTDGVRLTATVKSLEKSLTQVIMVMDFDHRHCIIDVKKSFLIFFTFTLFLNQVLLTTCVGSKEELEMLVTAASQFYAKYYQHSGSATPAKVDSSQLQI